MYYHITEEENETNLFTYFSTYWECPYDWVFVKMVMNCGSITDCRMYFAP